MKVNLPRYEKRERLCLSLGTSDYLSTVGVTSVLAHCTVIHSDSIRIPKLSNHCRSSDFNRKLCPIRAIKAYIDRTKSIRNGRTRLFIPTKGDHDLKKSTISSWIKYTISHAYKSLSKHQIQLLKVKAHELRALSTSWAYTSSIPLEEVIKAAVWSNSSTFASFYLRNMGSQAENLRQMGPIVAAQRMVGGGGPTIRSSR